CRLYGFVDTAYLTGRKAGDVARLLVEGGVDIIQLRAKSEPREQIVEMAEDILPVTRPAHVPLIINDYPDIAKEVNADGVHLGQEDLERHPFAKVRSLLGPERIIGISTHSIYQAMFAETMEPDYLAIGPIFPTGTKPGRPAVGIGLVEEWSSVSST